MVWNNPYKCKTKIATKIFYMIKCWNRILKKLQSSHRKNFSAFLSLFLMPSMSDAASIAEIKESKMTLLCFFSMQC